MPEHRQQTESAWSGLALSLLLHGGLAALAVSGAMLFPAWLAGGPHATGTPLPAVRAALVSQLPGAAIPLPAPTDAPTPNRLATANPAPGISRQVAPASARDAIKIPDLAQAQARAREQLLLDQERLAHTDARPDSRVAYGNRGAVSANAGTKQAGANPGSLQFGDASFGTRYRDWVNHLSEQLQASWDDQLLAHPGLLPGKVMVLFSVDRAGHLSGVQLKMASGQELLDVAGQAAISAGLAKELFPLPSDYERSRLDVGVTFVK